MKTKIIKWIIVLSTITIVIYFGMYFTQNYQAKTSLDKFNKQKIGTARDALIRCNWNIFSPEFAYIWFDNEGNISFDKQSKIFWLKDDWGNTSIGGTTIKNTTFHQLLTMVKEDCYQFQKPRGNSSDKTINWRWVAAPTEEEKKEREWEKQQSEKLYQQQLERWNNLSDEEKEKWREEQRKSEEIEKNFVIPTDEELEAMTPIIQ